MRGDESVATTEGTVRRHPLRIDRREFLLAVLGAAGGVMVSGACRGKSNTAPTAASGDAGTLPRPVPRPTLRLPGGDAGFPSPFTYMVGPGYQRMILIYDTLLWQAPTGQLVPWLASEWERSPDGAIYTFHLRDGASWHDGRPVTADDVVFTFEYHAAKQARIAPTVIVRPQEVAAVRATGEHTVEVRLERPLVTFPPLLASRLPVVPRHIWSSIDNPMTAIGPDVLVGSGPYRLDSYDRANGSYLYLANDRHFLGRPFVKRLEMRPVDDQLTALLAGHVDAGGPRPTGAPAGALRPFESDDAFGIVEGPLDLTVALYWNLARGGAPADVRFRRACAYAIDRRDLVRRLAGGRGEPGNPGFLPPDHPFHVGVEQYPFDPDAANRLLDEAGYERTTRGGLRRGPEGGRLRLSLLVIPELSDAVELVTAALRHLGVELALVPTDFPGLVAAMTGGRYDMAMPLFGNTGGDPDFMRTVYSSRAPKVFLTTHGYVDGELDELADAQRGTFDEVERRRLVASMQRIVARDIPALPMYYPTPVHVFRKAVFDEWAYTPGGGFLSSPYNKQLFVTGSKAGGLEVRPTS